MMVLKHMALGLAALMAGCMTKPFIRCPTGLPVT